MDINGIQAFLCVAEHLSFSLAAEQLHLTQPAVSKRISSLEEQLGSPLFDRINRSINLTEAGRTLLPLAQNILVDIENAKRQVSSLDGNISGSLSIATSHHIGLHRLPPTLKKFSRRYPDVALDIHFVDSEFAYDEVLKGKIELGVITLAPQAKPQVHSQQVWLDELCFVVAREHSLAQQGRLDLEQLSHFCAVFPGANTFTHHIVKALFTQQNLGLNISMTTNYLETIKMMVSIGLAWSVLPSSMLDDNLHRLDVDTQVLQRKLGYIHHTERSLSNAAKAFIALLDEEIQ